MQFQLAKQEVTFQSLLDLLPLQFLALLVSRQLSNLELSDGENEENCLEPFTDFHPGVNPPPGAIPSGNPPVASPPVASPPKQTGVLPPPGAIPSGVPARPQPPNAAPTGGKGKGAGNFPVFTAPPVVNVPGAAAPTAAPPAAKRGVEREMRGLRRLRY